MKNRKNISLARTDAMPGAETERRRLLLDAAAAGTADGGPGAGGPGRHVYRRMRDNAAAPMPERRPERAVDPRDSGQPGRTGAGEAERRIAELQAVNRELEAFSCAVSHDLLAPLRSIDSYSGALLEDPAIRRQLDEHAAKYVENIRVSCRRMRERIDDLFTLARVSRAVLDIRKVDLAALAREVATEIAFQYPRRQVEFVAPDALFADADARLMRIVLENLLGNAWKFTAKTPLPRVEFGRALGGNGGARYFVHDNGAGFNMTYAERLFRPFQRLHSVHEFEGTGLGLATVQRIVSRHGGRVWAEAVAGAGAKFHFLLRAR